jgi:hypothetical protein
MTLDATIGQVFAPYHLSRCNGHPFWHKIMTCGIVRWLSKASVQKAQNRPSTQLIKATSCKERSNNMIGAEELSNFSSYQTLTTDRNW